MLKLTTSDSTLFKGEPNVVVIDAGSEGTSGLVKRAADSAITEFAASIKPDPSKIYLHILAMGSGESVGANRNADWFPEDNLKQHFKTFETSPAHVFTNHVNRDPAKAIGQVMLAIYNDRMHRVELIAWVDRVKGKSFVERIERGEYPSTSMACKTPYDICSICGNKARTRDEYCSHLKTELGRLYPDGRKAMAINSGPLRFFDISFVIRPADVTSEVMQKVASNHYLSDVVGSAEHAEEEGLVEKVATMKKLSEFIKELEGDVGPLSGDLTSILAKVSDPSVDVIPSLTQFPLHQVLDTFAALGMTPSIGFLAEMVGHRICGEGAEGIGTLVEGYLKEHGADQLHINDTDAEGGGPHPSLVSLLQPFVKQASVFPQYVMQRSYGDGAIRLGNVSFVPGTGYGYAGNGPGIEPTPQEVYRSLMGSGPEGTPDGPSERPIWHMIKTLLTVGGAALAAKWYITKMIDKRLKEAQLQSNNANTQPGIKIQLVKSASDAKIASDLARISMLQSTQRSVT
jgi:hypothetical protein